MEISEDDLNIRMKRLEPAYRRMVYQALVNAEEKERDDFTKRVHNLPPEVFDMIKTYTFTRDRVKVKIDKDYKSPNCMQVRRLTRLRGYLYYMDSISMVEDEELLYRWIKSMDEETQCYPKDIRSDTNPQLRSPADDEEAAQQASDILEALHNIHECEKVRLSIMDVCVNDRFPSDGKEIWTWCPKQTLRERRLGRSEHSYGPRNRDDI
ncbi:hypothetical protein LTR85_009791 [Meristemomyces frigidus]|nr:hypothetical protein LTR85_009791 [Meristemomyces frigidus]